MVSRNAEDPSEEESEEKKYYEPEPEPEKTKEQREREAKIQKALIESASMKMGVTMDKILELADMFEDEELDAFGDYLKTQQAVGPLFNTASYNDRNRRIAQARVELIKKIKAVRKEEEKAYEEEN